MAQEAIFDALGTVVAQDQLRTIRRFASEDLFRGGGIAAVAGAAVLLYTGTRVFVELDDGIDAIWRTNKGPTVHPVLASLKSRLLAVLLMIVLGVLLIVVILSSVLVSAYAGVLERFPILGVWIGPAISTFVHYGLLSSFFTLIYKWLPTGNVPWRYALIGGLVNALLFAAGNRALVFYFEVTQLTSAFGATAGFAAIMVWMYWTSLTIPIGAQVGRARWWRGICRCGSTRQIPSSRPQPRAARRSGETYSPRFVGFWWREGLSTPHLRCSGRDDGASFRTW
jgi:membrane protein